MPKRDVAHADRHVPSGGIETRGAMEPVPDREAAREIRLQLRRIHRVMNRVHARRGHDPRQRALHAVAQPGIRVMKQYRHQGETLPDGERRG